MIPSLILGIFAGYLHSLDLFISFAKETVFGLFLFISILLGAKMGNNLNVKGLLKISMFWLIGFALITEFSRSVFELNENISFNGLLNIMEDRSEDLFSNRTPFDLFVAFGFYGLLLFGGIMFYRVNLRIAISKIQQKRIPKKVVDFVTYLIINSKSKEEIKRQLKAKGLNNEEYLDLIFETVLNLRDPRMASKLSI